METRRKIDVNFINKLKVIVDENLQNDQFGVSVLAQMMHISRSALYAKVKNATGLSVSKFICKIRLKTAHDLLLNCNLAVAEVAFEVGFNSTSYFIKCFHEHYGYPPGEAHLHAVDSSRECPEVISTEKTPTFTKRWFKTRPLTFAFVTAILFLLVVSTFLFNTMFAGKSTDNNDLSIAVLPFKNLCYQQEDAYLADGISEDVINNLSLVVGLKVISRTSTEKYRNSEKTLSDIGQELKVTYLLEGSVQKEYDQTKIRIQLNDAKNNRVLWSESFYNKIDDTFRSQSSISKHVSRRIQNALAVLESENIDHLHTINSKAYGLYLKGQYFKARRTYADIHRGIDYFNQALAIDTNYCLAIVGLADAYLTLTYWDWYPWDEGAILIKKLAHKARAIDGHLAEVHCIWGLIKLYYDFDYSGALDQFGLAINKNPNDAVSFRAYATGLQKLGRLNEAVSYLDKALELNPNSVNSYNLKSSILYQKGDYNGSLEWGEKGLELDPEFPNFYNRRFKSFVWLKQDANALKAMSQIMHIVEPECDNSAKINQIYRLKGINGVVDWYAEWHHVIGELNRRKLFTKYVHVADLYTAIGEFDKAMDYLELYIDEVHDKPVEIFYNAQFARLYNHPRFMALKKRLTH